MDTNTNNGMVVSDKTNISQNAFWQSVLGMTVDITINQLGTDAYKVLQVDQFTIIAENEEYGYVLINKSSIIAAYAPDTAFPELAKNLVEGVRKISYKPSAERTQNNKKKFSKPYKSYDKKYDREDVSSFPSMNYDSSAKDHEEPVIIVKKKRYVG